MHVTDCCMILSVLRIGRPYAWSFAAANNMLEPRAHLTDRGGHCIVLLADADERSWHNGQDELTCCIAGGLRFLIKA